MRRWKQSSYYSALSPVLAIDIHTSVNSKSVLLVAQNGCPESTFGSPVSLLSYTPHPSSTLDVVPSKYPEISRTQPPCSTGMATLGPSHQHPGSGTTVPAWPVALLVPRPLETACRPRVCSFWSVRQSMPELCRSPPPYTPSGLRHTGKGKVLVSVLSDPL